MTFFLCKSNISYTFVTITVIDISSPSFIFEHSSIYLFAYKFKNKERPEMYEGHTVIVTSE